MPSAGWSALLPHVGLWIIAAGFAAGLVVVLWPVLPTLLVALAVAALTEPVVFRPWDERLARWLPRWAPAARRWFAAMIATVLLAAFAGASALVVLWALLGSFSATVDGVIGIAVQDGDRIQAVAMRVGRRVADLAALYGQGVIDAHAIGAEVQAVLARTRVGPEVLHYLITGTGGFLARAALVLVTVFYLFSQGPGLAGWIARWLPLDTAGLAQVAQRYRATAYHLLAHIIARAMAHGLGLGLIAWGIAGFNGVLVAVAAGLLALLPLVGPLVAWLPLAGLIWSKGHPLLAIAFAVCGYLWTWLVERLFRRVAASLGTDALWIEFLVFLGLVGGVIAHGPAGLVLGPAAVLGAIVAAQLIRQVYWAEGNEP